MHTPLALWPLAALMLGCTPHPAPPQALPEAEPEAPGPEPTAPEPAIPAPSPPPPMVLAPTPGGSIEPGEVLEEPIIVGSLDDQSVREAVYQQLDHIGRCVDWAVGYDLFVPGQLVVRLAVAPAGRVSSVEVAADATGGDPEVHGCLEAAFGDLVFPRTSTVTWVCYPINVAY